MELKSETGSAGNCEHITVVKQDLSLGNDDADKKKRINADIIVRSSVVIRDFHNFLFNIFIHRAAHNHSHLVISSGAICEGESSWHGNDRPTDRLGPGMASMAITGEGRDGK